MNGIGGGPSQTYPVLSPTSPLGKPAVGLESPASKDWSVPPVVAAAELHVVRNQQQQAAVSAYESGQLAQAAAQLVAQAPQAANRPVSTGDNSAKNTENKSSAAPGDNGQARLKRRLAAALDEPSTPLGSLIDQRV